MSLFKTLFGGKETSPEPHEQNKQTYNFEVLTYDGAQALRLGKTDYAIRCLTHALDIQEDEDARINLAHAYMQSDQLELAAEQYALLGELNPSSPIHAITHAEILFQLEQYEPMAEACRRALAIDPTLAMPHLLLARLHMAQHQFEQAEAEATQAIEAKPDYEEAYQLRATIRQASHQCSAAEADVDHLLDQGVSGEDLLLLKAQLRECADDTEAAVVFYNKAIAHNPFLATAYAHLRGLYRRLGQESDAERITAEAVEQLGTDPEDPSLLSAPKTDGRTAEQDARDALNALNPYQLGTNE